MSFPAARLETRIQEFVMYGSVIPVPTIGTVLGFPAKEECHDQGRSIVFEFASRPHS